MTTRLVAVLCALSLCGCVSLRLSKGPGPDPDFTPRPAAVVRATVSPMAPPDPMGCVRHDCSNDAVRIPKLGDAELCGDPVSDAYPLEYVFALEDESISFRSATNCLNVDLTRLITATAYDALQGRMTWSTARIKVQACRIADGKCGGWSNVVEVMPFMCVRDYGEIPDPRPGCPECTRHDSVEEPCFGGAPLRRRAPGTK